MNEYADLNHETAVLVADLLSATSGLSAHIQQALAIENAEGLKRIQARLMAGKVDIVWFISATRLKLMAISNDRETEDLKIFDLDLTGNDGPQGETDIYGAGMGCLH